VPDENSHVSCGHGKHFLKICKQIFAFSTGKMQCAAAVARRRTARRAPRAMRRRAPPHRACELTKRKITRQNQCFFDSHQKSCATTDALSRNASMTRAAR